MDRDQKQALIKQTESVVNEAAKASQDPSMEVNEPPKEEAFKPQTLYENTPGGETVDKTLSNYKDDPSDAHSPITSEIPPGAYNRYTRLYNRKQEMEKEHNNLMMIEDDREREIAYSDFLMRYYGNDILRSKGHDLTNPTYWMNKFRENDFSHPLHNDYILESTIQEAEHAFASYEQFKLNNGFKGSKSRDLLQDLYGMEIDEDIFTEISEMMAVDIDYEDFDAQARAGLMGAEERLMYDEQGNRVGFVGNDGKIYGYMTEAEFNESRPHYDVVVQKENGDLAVNNITSVGAALNRFKQGLVRSAYDVYGFSRMLVNLGIDAGEHLMNGFEGDFEAERMLEAYQKVEATANASDWLGRPMWYDMGEDTRRFINPNVAQGVAGFAGTMVGTMATIKVLAPLKGATKGAARAVNLGRKNVVTKSNRAMNKTIEASVNRISDIGYAPLRTQSGIQGARNTHFTNAVHQVTREQVDQSTSRAVRGSLQRRLTRALGDEVQDTQLRQQLSRNVTNQLMDIARTQDLTDDVVRNVLREQARSTMQASGREVIRREVATNSVRSAMGQYAKKGVSGVLDAFHGVAGVKRLSAAQQRAIINKVGSAKGAQKRSVLQRELRDLAADQVDNTFLDSVVSGTTRQFINETNQNAVASTIVNAAKTAGRQTAKLAGRMHGVYMGNPLGNVPAQSSLQVLAKRGSFAATYAGRDWFQTYGSLRTMGADEQTALTRANQVFALNTAVAFFLTGGIDDSPTLDYAKVFGRKAPQSWRYGEATKSMSRLVFTDTLMDTADNFVTMSAAQYFMNEENDAGVQDFLRFMAQETFQDPVTMFSVGMVSMLGARGSRRAHSGGMDVPAHTYNKLRDDLMARSHDPKLSVEDRLVYERIAQDMDAKYRENLRNQASEEQRAELDQGRTPENMKVESGQAILDTLEYMHQRFKSGNGIYKDPSDPDRGQIGGETMVSRRVRNIVHQDKLRIMNYVYKHSADVKNYYETRNMNIVNETLSHGLGRTIMDRVTDTNERAKGDPNRTKYANEMGKSLEQLATKYGLEPDESGILDGIARELENVDDKMVLDRSTLTDDQRLEALKHTEVTPLDRLDVNSSQYKNAQKYMSSRMQDFLHIRFDGSGDNTEAHQVYRKAMQIISQLYSDTGGEHPVVRQTDDGGREFLLRIDKMDTPVRENAGDTIKLQSAYAMEKVRQVASALHTIRHGKSISERAEALRVFNNHTEIPRHAEDLSWNDPRVVLRTLNDMVNDKYIGIREAVALLREVNSDHRVYGEPSNVLVKYSRLVDTMDELRTLQQTNPGSPRVNRLYADANRNINEMASQLTTDVTNALVAELNSYRSIASAERSERRNIDEITTEEVVRFKKEIPSIKEMPDSEVRNLLNYVINRNGSIETLIRDDSSRYRNPVKMLNDFYERGLINKDTRDAYINDPRSFRMNQRIDAEIKEYRRNKEMLRLDNEFLYREIDERGSRFPAFEKYEDEFRNIQKLFNERPHDEVNLMLKNFMDKVLKDPDAVMTGTTRNILKDVQENYARRSDGDRRSDAAYDIKNRIRKEEGYIVDEIRQLKDSGISDSYREQLLRDFYFDRYWTGSGSLDENIRDIGIDGIVRTLELPLESDISQRIANEILRDGDFKPEAINDTIDRISKKIGLINDFETKGVKTLHNNTRKLVIDMNKLLPKTFRQVSRYIGRSNNVALQRSIRNEPGSIINALEQRSDIPNNLTKRLVNEAEALQRAIRDVPNESGLLVTEDIRGTDANASHMRQILYELGYGDDVDFLMQQDLSAEGIHSFGEDVAYIEGKVNKSMSRYGYTQETIDDPQFLNDQVRNRTGNSYYMDDNTIIHPNRIALLADQFNPNNATRRISPSKETRNIPDLKPGKIAGDLEGRVQHSVDSRGYGVRTNENLNRFLELRNMINVMEEHNPFSVVPMVSIRNLNYELPQLRQFWRVTEIEVNGIEYAYFDGFKAQDAINHLQARGYIDERLIVPDFRDAMNSDKFKDLTRTGNNRGLIKEAGTNVEEIGLDTLANTSRPSVQEVISETVRMDDPNAPRRKFTDRYEVSDLGIDELVVDIPSESMTVSEWRQYLDGRTDAASRSLLKYLDMATEMSNETFGDFEITSDSAKLLSIPEVRNIINNRKLSQTQMRKKVSEALERYNSNMRNESSDKLTASHDELPSRTLDRRYYDVQNSNEQVITSEQLNKLNPEYNVEVTDENIRELINVRDSYDNKRVHYERNENPESKLFAMRAAIDQDDAGLRIPLKFIEEVTDPEWQYIKQSNMLDDETVRIIDNKLEQLDRISGDAPTDPKGTIEQRPQRSNLRATSTAISKESLSGKRLNLSDNLLVNQAMTRSLLNEYNQFNRLNQEGGLSKLRELLQNREYKNNIAAQAYSKFVMDEVLKYTDNPNMYMAVGEDRRASLSRSFLRVAEISKIIEDISPHPSIKENLYETALQIYGHSTGTRYQGEYQQYFAVDTRTGRLIDTGTYSNRNPNDSDGLFSMFLKNDFKKDTAIIKVDKDSFLRDGQTSMKVANLFDTDGNPTDSYRNLKTQSQARLFDYISHKYTDIETEDTNIKNLFAQFRAGEELSTVQENELRMAFTDYISFSEGQQRNLHDTVEFIVRSEFGDNSMSRKMSNNIIQAALGDKGLFEFNKSEFSRSTQSILNTVRTELEAIDANEAYLSRLNDSEYLNKLTDIIVHGVDTSRLSSETKTSMKYLQGSIRQDSIQTFERELGPSKVFGKLLATLPEKQSTKLVKDYSIQKRKLQDSMREYTTRMIEREENRNLVDQRTEERMKKASDELKKQVNDMNTFIKGKGGDSDIDLLRDTVYTEVYMNYLSRSESAANYAFMNRSHETIEGLLKRATTDDPRDLAIGRIEDQERTVRDIAHNGEKILSFDIETIPDPFDPNVSHPFQAGFFEVSYRYNTETGQYERVKGNLVRRVNIDNKSITDDILNNPTVKDFIREREGTGWGQAFEGWRKGTDRQQLSEVQNIIGSYRNFISANGREFDIPQLERIGIKFPSDMTHIDNFNDLRGLLDTTSDAVGLRQDAYMERNQKVREAVDALVREHDGNKEIAMHDGLNDAMATAEIRLEMINRGLVINRNQGSVAKPLLDLETDTGHTLRNRVQQIDERLKNAGTLNRGEDGITYDNSPSEALTRIVAALNETEKNRALNKYAKNQQRDWNFRNNAIYSKKVATLIRQGGADHLYKFMDTIAQEMREYGDNKRFFQDIISPALLRTYNELNRIHAGKPTLFGKGETNATRLNLNQAMELLLRADTYDTPEQAGLGSRDIFFREIENRLGKQPNELRELYKSKKVSDLDVYKLHRDFDNLFVDTNPGDIDELSALTLSNYRRGMENTDSPLRKLGIEGTKSQKSLHTPYMRNLDHSKALPQHARRTFNRGIIQRTLNKLINDPKTLIDAGRVKLENTSYNILSAGGVNELRGYSDAVNRLDGTSRTYTEPKPGDIIMSERGFVRTFGEDSLANFKADGMDYVIALRHPSDADYSLSTYRIFIDNDAFVNYTGAEGERGNEVSVYANRHSIKQVNGDFDGDHLSLFGNKNATMTKLLETVHKSQHQMSEPISNLLDSVVKRDFDSETNSRINKINNDLDKEISTLYNRVNNLQEGDTSPLRAIRDLSENPELINRLINKIYKTDSPERFNIERELNYIKKNHNDYDIDGIVDGLVGKGTVKDTPIYRDIAEKVIPQFWIRDFGNMEAAELSSREFAVLREVNGRYIDGADKKFKQQQALLQYYGKIFGDTTDSATGVMQKDAIAEALNRGTQIMDIPLARVGKSNISLDDSATKRFITIYDSLDEDGRQPIIDRINEETQRALEVYDKNPDATVKENDDLFIYDTKMDGAKVIQRFVENFDMFDLTSRYNAEANERYKDILREFDSKKVPGLLDETFRALEISESLRDGFKDYLEFNDENAVWINRSEMSDYRDFAKDHILDKLMSQIEEDADRYTDFTLDFRDRDSSAPARVLFTSKKHLAENQALLSKDLYDRTYINKVDKVTVERVTGDLKVDDRVTEGQILGRDGEDSISSPMTGRIARINENGDILILSEQRLSSDVKIQGSESGMLKNTIAGMKDIETVKGEPVDIIVDIADLENIQKTSPEMFNQIFRNQSDITDLQIRMDGEDVNISDGVVFDTDIRLAEVFTYIKNHNENMDVSEFGGRQQGGTIDLLTMISNMTGDMNTVLTGYRGIEGLDGDDIRFRLGLDTVESYLDKKRPDVMERNVAGDIRALRIMTALKLVDDRQRQEITSMSDTQVRELIDDSPIKALKQLDNFEREISRVTKVRGDLSKLVDQYLDRTNNQELTDREKQFLKNLLGNEIKEKLNSPIYTGIEASGVEGSPGYKKGLVKGAKKISNPGKIIDQTHQDMSIASGRYDLNDSHYMWSDAYKDLHRDARGRTPYIDRNLGDLSLAGRVPMGEGYPGAKGNQYHGIDQDFMLDNRGLRTTMGKLGHEKTGTPTIRDIEIRQDSTQPMKLETIRDTFGHLNNQKIRDYEVPSSIKMDVDGGAMLRYIFSNSIRSADDRLTVKQDVPTRIRGNVNKFAENFDVTGRKDHFENDVFMYNKITTDEAGRLRYSAAQSKVNFKMSDMKDINRLRGGAMHRSARENRSRSEEIVNAYQRTFTETKSGITKNISQTNVKLVFSALNETKRKLLNPYTIDAQRFTQDFEDARIRVHEALNKRGMENNDPNSMPDSSIGKHRTKTLRGDFTRGEKDAVEYHKNLLTTSGLSDSTKHGAAANRVIANQARDFNYIFSQLSTDFGALRSVLKAEGLTSNYNRFLKYSQLLNSIKTSGNKNPELILRYVGDELGVGDIDTAIDAMEMYVIEFKKNSGHVVRAHEAAADKVEEYMDRVMPLPRDQKYLLRYPIKHKSKKMSAENKNRAYMEMIKTTFDPKKFSMLEKTDMFDATVEDPFDSIQSAIFEISKVGAVKNLAHNLKQTGAQDNVRIQDLANEYIRTMYEDGGYIREKSAQDMYAMLRDDPHVGRYMEIHGPHILDGIENIDRDRRGVEIVGRMRSTLDTIQEEATMRLRDLSGEHDPGVRHLLNEPTMEDLRVLYERTDNKLVREATLDLMNIKKVQDEIRGSIMQLREDAPNFSDWLRQKLPDSDITDTYMRSIEYDKDSGGIKMKPLTEGDSSYISDAMSYGFGGRKYFEQRLLSKALNGEIYASNKSLSNHINNFHFKRRAPGRIHKWTRQVGLFFNKFVMGNPLRLPERVFGRFFSFDMAMLSLTEPRSFLKLGKAGRDLRQRAASQGKQVSPELQEFYRNKGLDPLSAQQRDVVTRTEMVQSVPGKIGEVQDFTLRTTEYMSDFSRYAAWLAIKEKIDNTGRVPYGPAYKKKAYIDSLPDSGQKAWEIMTASLPTVGDLPYVSQRMAPYFLFTSFGLGLTRTSLDWVHSGYRMIEDAIMRGDKSGAFRQLGTAGLGVMGIYLAASAILEMYGDIYNVEDEEIENWKDEQYFIDPYGTFLFGSPVTRTTWNPVKMVQNDWFRPLQEGFKGPNPWEEGQDGLHYAAYGLLNHQALSKLNPMFKTPIEVFTGHDLFGSLPVDQRQQYEFMDNVRRKLLGPLIGNTAANTMVNNMNTFRHNNDPWLRDFGRSMANAAANEFGNSRAYKQEVRDFYRARDLIYSHIYRDEDAREKNQEDVQFEQHAELFNVQDDQFNESDYVQEDAQRVSTLIRRAMDNQEDMSVIFSILQEEIDKGTGISSLRSALNRNSISRLMDRVDNVEEFKDSLSDTDWKVINNAIGYEVMNFPGMNELLPYQRYYQSGYYNIPYNRHNYYHRALNPYDFARNRFQDFDNQPYKHWSEEISPHMGTQEARYTPPGIDPGMGVERDGEKTKIRNDFARQDPVYRGGL